MTSRFFMTAVLATLTAATLLQAGELAPAPSISQFIKLDIPHSVAYATRTAVGNSGTFVGLALTCSTRAPFESEVTIYFGSFPSDRQAVQLAVRRSDQSVERFGPIVTAGPESGFHSPRIDDPKDADRFVRAALLPGSLISNGYRSFWNRADNERNREIRESFLNCLARGT